MNNTSMSTYSSSSSNRRRSWRIIVFYYCLQLVLHVGIVLTHPTIEADKSGDSLITELDLVEDNGNVENALLNYLFAKEFVNRMRHQVDVRDIQQKRNYWKQCAFNAVSCFG